MTSLRISIVEDDAILCDLLTLRLTKIGYSIRGMYASGEDALRRLSDHTPDVVLMDISLSGKLDGIETANLVQARYDLPVVYLTASTDSKTFERAMNSGECEYVIKPFTDNDLYIAIELAYHKHKLGRKRRNMQKCLENVVANFSDAIIATDDRGVITMMNPAAIALTGRKDADTPRVHVVEIIKMADETGRPVEDPFQRIRSEMDVMDIPDGVSIITDEGKRVPVRGSVSPIKDEEGHFKGIILTLAPRIREKVLRSV
jgi:PAS domain S-box-containing protein